MQARGLFPRVYCQNWCSGGTNHATRPMVTALFVLLTETTGRQAHAVLHGFCKRGRGKEGVYSRGILNQSHQVAANLNRATSPTASYDCLSRGCRTWSVRLSGYHFARSQNIHHALIAGDYSTARVNGRLPRPINLFPPGCFGSAGVYAQTSVLRNYWGKRFA